MTKIPTGLWQRGRKLAWSASKLALTELSERISGIESIESKVRATKELVQTLGELKGASMKLGQLLSIDVSGILPPEVQTIFENLHKDATAISFDELRPVLEEELGEKVNELTDIQEKPLASASMGQVHRARLHNQNVVLKIQYPGVTDTIPQDLRLLRTLVHQFFKLQGKDIDFAPLFEELQQVLTLEGDYRHELAMLERYKLNFANKPYVIPAAIREFSTQRVLCMEFVDAIPLRQWARGASQEKRNQIASHLIDLYFEEFFVHGLVQTDPNPGNFLVTSDDRLVLLDFGAVKEYSKTFIEGYRRIVSAALKGPREELLKESFALGLLDPRESAEAQQVYCLLIEEVAALRRPGEFDFADKKFIDESSRLTLELTRKLKYSPPPKDLVFLHRKLAGVFAINKMLEAKINLANYWDKFLG